MAMQLLMESLMNYNNDSVRDNDSEVTVLSDMEEMELYAECMVSMNTTDQFLMNAVFELESTSETELYSEALMGKDGFVAKIIKAIVSGTKKLYEFIKNILNKIFNAPKALKKKIDEITNSAAGWGGFFKDLSQASVDVIKDILNNHGVGWYADETLVDVYVKISTDTIGVLSKFVDDTHVDKYMLTKEELKGNAVASAVEAKSRNIMTLLDSLKLSSSNEMYKVYNGLFKEGVVDNISDKFLREDYINEWSIRENNVSTSMRVKKTMGDYFALSNAVKRDIGDKTSIIFVRTGFQKRAKHYSKKLDELYDAFGQKSGNIKKLYDSLDTIVERASDITYEIEHLSSTMNNDRLTYDKSENNVTKKDNDDNIGKMLVLYSKGLMLTINLNNFLTQKFIEAAIGSKSETERVINIFINTIMNTHEDYRVNGGFVKTAKDARKKIHDNM